MVPHTMYLYDHYIHYGFCKSIFWEISYRCFVIIKKKFQNHFSASLGTSCRNENNNQLVKGTVMRTT